MPPLQDTAPILGAGKSQLNEKRDCPSQVLGITHVNHEKLRLCILHDHVDRSGQQREWAAILMTGLCSHGGRVLSLRLPASVFCSKLVLSPIVGHRANSPAESTLLE